MWTKMGPVWLLNPPPPPPPGPHIATDISMFSHICQTYYPLFFLVVHMYPVWWGLHDTLVPLDSTYASPGPPKMKTKIWKKCSSDYFHILHIVELWCDFKKFVGPWSIYIFIKCLWVLLTNVFWFRATGGYICGCGRPSNLVIKYVCIFMSIFMYELCLCEYLC